MTDQIDLPKMDEWVLIVNGISEAFENNYQGQWSQKHHKLIGQLLQVSRVDTLPSVMITCKTHNHPEEHLGFPPECIQAFDKDVPEGWYPIDLPPSVVDEKYYLNYNVYIGLTSKDTLLLISYINNIWCNYDPGFQRKDRVRLQIIAYQPISNWPIKKKDSK